jgi:hypothetical protein
VRNIFGPFLAIACRVYLVEFFATLLAKIFIRRALGAKNAYTGAVLPDFTNVALNEEAGNIFGEFNGIEKVQIGAFNRRTTWIFFSITDASNSLILLFLKVVASVHHVKVVGFRVFVVIVFLVPLSPSAEKGIVEIFKWLRG